MPTDLLVVAGLAAEILERHGFIACGRREDGVARVDFWTRDGIAAFRHELTDAERTVDEVVTECLAVAGDKKPRTPPGRTSHLS